MLLYGKYQLLKTNVICVTRSAIRRVYHFIYVGLPWPTCADASASLPQTVVSVWSRSNCTSRTSLQALALLKWHKISLRVWSGIRLNWILSKPGGHQLRHWEMPRCQILSSCCCVWWLDVFKKLLKEAMFLALVLASEVVSVSVFF